MADTHIHIHLDGGSTESGLLSARSTQSKRRKASPSTKKKAVRRPGAGLPKKYAKMGFKKGWKAYKKTPAYKRKKKARR